MIIRSIFYGIGNCSCSSGASARIALAILGVQRAGVALFYGDGRMNDLLSKYNDYMRLVGCRAKYILENGDELEFAYHEKNFAHLIGLHKLTDVQLVQFWLDRNNKSVKLKDVLKK